MSALPSIIALNPQVTESFEFKTVREPSKHYDIVKNVFQTVLEPLYGSQEKALEQIRKREDRRAEVLVSKDDTVGLIVYKHGLHNKYDNFGPKDSVEIKTLLVIDSEKNSGKGVGSKLLNEIIAVAKRRFAASIHVTVSENVPTSLQFFKKKGFQVIKTWEGRYVPDVKEFLLEYKMPKVAPKIVQISTSFNAAPASSSSSSSSSFLSNPPRNAQRSSYGKAAHPRNSSQARAATPYARPSNVQKSYDVTLKDKYLKQIQSGRKTFEGRINTGQFTRYKVGDRVKFFNNTNSVVCEVTSIKKFPSFSQMLETCGVNSCLSDVWNLQEGIRVYDQIPSYNARAAQHGVLAIGIKVIK